MHLVKSFLLGMQLLACTCKLRSCTSRFKMPPSFLPIRRGREGGRRSRFLAFPRLPLRHRLLGKELHPRGRARFAHPARPLGLDWRGGGRFGSGCGGRTQTGRKTAGASRLKVTPGVSKPARGKRPASQDPTTQSPPRKEKSLSGAR